MKSRLHVSIWNGPSLLRILADMIMVTGSYGLMMLARYVLALKSGIVKPNLFSMFATYYWHGLLILLPCCLIAFISLGFYGRGRYYRSKFKILVVFHGITIGYLATGFFVFYFLDFVGIFSRGVLLFSYILSNILLIGARLWSTVWKMLYFKEAVPTLRAAVPALGREGRSVLVIGGAGYIGSALIPKLLVDGYRVRLMDIMVYGDEAISGFRDHPELEIFRRDFRQVNSVVEAMQGIDTVIHLGAIVGDPACALDENLTREINLMATRMIGEVAKGLRVRKFIFASTCSVYGANAEILDERSILKPVSLYARTKIACEKVLFKLSDAAFQPTILRFGTIFGLSGRTRFDLVINLLTAKAVVEGVIPVSGGEQGRPFLHVDDAARAVYLMVKAPLELVGNEVFNVGFNEQNYTIDDTARIIEQGVSDAVIKEMPFDGDIRNYRVDFSKIINALGFKSHWTIDRGVRQVIEALRCGEIGDYRDPRYSNVKFLSEASGVQGLRYDREHVESLYLIGPESERT
jgi:nucleoside-diphosphate-sugar epimerase